MTKVVRSIEGLELGSKTLSQLEYTYGNYMEFLEELHKLDARTLKLFLETLKDRELVNNQETELEDAFLMELYRKHQRKDSIEIVTGLFSDGIITLDEAKKLHRVVIRGSSDDVSKNYDYRTDDNKWVGGFGTDGAMRVDYYPPLHTEIETLMTYTLDYLNNENIDSELAILIKPFIVHALIAYIQPFGNGNTRLSRVLQHGKIWHMTNSVLGANLPLPALYLSKNYLMTRPTYRNLIKEVAVSQNWDAWLYYNLNMVDEHVYFAGNKLSLVRTKF